VAEKHPADAISRNLLLSHGHKEISRFDPSDPREGLAQNSGLLAVLQQSARRRTSRWDVENCFGGWQVTLLKASHLLLFGISTARLALARERSVERGSQATRPEVRPHACSTWNMPGPHHPANLSFPHPPEPLSL